MGAYIGSARAGVNIVVDNMSIQEVGYDYCSSNLILNGDAETGDARFWYIRGSKDLGTIEMVEPGADNTAYGFSHVGKRGNRNTGIWQELPKRCIGFNTRWEISAQFKIPYACSKPSGKENGGYGNGYSNYDGDNGDSTCPIFRLEAYDKSGENLMDFYVQNQDESEWIQNEWNTFRAFFTMNNPSFHARERLFIMAVVPVEQTYQIDSISFTLSPTAYPSVSHSIVPSKSITPSHSIVPSKSITPSHSIVPTSNAYVFADIDDLMLAVDLYISNKDQAINKYGLIRDWQTHLVTSFSELFDQKSAFNADLSEWDVSGGTNFYRMFCYASAFNADLSKWNVSGGNNFYNMFGHLPAFNSDLSQWDVSRGTDFGYMFIYAPSFSSNLCDWNIDYHHNDHHNMFYLSGCPNRSDPSDSNVCYNCN